MKNGDLSNEGTKSIKRTAGLKQFYIKNRDKSVGLIQSNLIMIISCLVNVIRLCDKCFLALLDISVKQVSN